MTSRRLKPSPARIAEAHLATSERGPRLLAATGGDAEHAARIDRVLEDLKAHSSTPRSSEVIRLPTRPYDREERELEPELEAPAAWTSLSVGVAIGAGLLLVLILFAIAGGLYSLLTLL
jgi:hypothetical protein